MQGKEQQKDICFSVCFSVITFWQIPQVTTARAEILKLECGHVVKMTQENGVTLKKPKSKTP